MISYEMKEGQRAYSFTLPKLPVGTYSIKASSADGVVVTDKSGKVVHLVDAPSCKMSYKAKEK